MGAISSTLKLMDNSSATIQKTINAMNKMIDVMEKVNSTSEMPGLDGMFAEVRTDINLASHALEEFNRELEEAQNNTDPVSNGIQKWNSDLLTVNAALDLFNKGLNLAKSTVGKVTGLLAEADTGNLAKQQLAVVMSNQGETYEGFESVLAKAAEMSVGDRSTYSSELFTGAAAELSTYLQSSEAVNRLLDSTMADYAAGMGGINLSYNQMVDYATQLGKALEGSYDGLTKKGFVLTDTQKEIIELGTEMERVAVLEEVIGESWGGLAEALASTPQGVLQGVKNELNDIKASMGQDIYGEVLNVAQVVRDNLPLIQSLAGTAVEILQGLAGFMADPLLPGVMSFGAAIQDTYYFFNDNWTNIEPILVGIGTAVGGLVAAYAIYKGVLFTTQALELASAVAKAVKTKATLAETSATAAATAAQWGLNAALLANPMTWVVVVIIAVIAAIVALSLWLYKLWQTNIDFRVGVIQVWNGLLGFFDQVPIFFQWVGNGILDAFSHMKQGTAVLLQDMINNAIEQINKLISLVNNIPGVAIEAIDGVTFGTEIALQEEAKRQERASNLQESRDAAALKAAERELQLAKDEARWREEAAAKEAELQAQKEENESRNNPYEALFNGNSGGITEPVEISGGSLDKVGKIGNEVDISNQSLMYLRDIAEIQALESVNAHNVISYEGIRETRLSDADADLLRSASGGETKIYYLNYSGGVNIQTEVKKGEDWNSIRQQMEEEIDNEIESGLSDIDRVVNG